MILVRGGEAEHTADHYSDLTVPAASSLMMQTLSINTM